jgi:hypothetical protein
MTTLVFVHGWSVNDTSTYGQMPELLQQRAAADGMTLTLADVWLSEYVSFDDAVTISDLVHAFDRALRDLHLRDASFACVTHSFGGPVVREWLRAQRQQPGRCSTIKLTHLVMLAPANFGSALARLGSEVLGELKAWWHAIQPGRQLLEWMELGSAASLELNLDSIHGPDPTARGQYLFVLTGDRPDRALYDYLIPYTGEDGSDGVVRIAAANLNAQHAVLGWNGKAAGMYVDELSLDLTRGPRFAFKIIAGAAHSGALHGILHSAAPFTADEILRCLGIREKRDYLALTEAFDRENGQRDDNRVELESADPYPARVHIHDPRSQLIVRITDDSGEALTDAGFLLTAGPQASPDLMPPGFMLDRQVNARHLNTVTLFLNHTLLAGAVRVAHPANARQTLRPTITSHRPYGANVQPANLTGLVHHALSLSQAGDDLFTMLGAHQTTVLDVVLSRKIHAGVFRLTQDLAPQDFSNPVPGPIIG